MDLILLTMADKWQTRPLVREGAPHGQDSNFQTRMNIWSWGPTGLDTKTDRLTVSCSVTLTLNGGIRKTIVVQGSRSRKENQEFIRNPFVRELTRQFSSSVFSCGVLTSGHGSWRSDWFVNQNQVRHSGREDTRSPVGNGASIRQSLIYSIKVLGHIKFKISVYAIWKTLNSIIKRKFCWCDTHP
jgi:hypothetical protein